MNVTLLWCLLGFWQTAPVPEKPPEEPRFDYIAWADARYEELEGRDNRVFDLSQVYLGLRARFGPHWRALVDVEYEHEESFSEDGESGGVFIDRAFVEYRQNNAARWRLGKLYSPAGIWKTMHWDVTVDSIARPIMEQNGYMPSKSTGLSFLGTHIQTHGLWNYTLMAAQVEQEGDENARHLDDARSLGTDLHYSYQNRLMGGISLFGYRNPHDEDTQVVGVQPYFETKWLDDALLWRGEFLWLDRRDADDVHTFYTELKYRTTPSTYLLGRYDRGDDEQFEERAGRRLIGLTFGKRFSRQWRAKAEFQHNRYEGHPEHNYKRWALWLGYVLK